jgi:hypothetical protein
MDYTMRLRLGQDVIQLLWAEHRHFLHFPGPAQSGNALLQRVYHPSQHVLAGLLCLADALTECLSIGTGSVRLCHEGRL